MTSRVQLGLISPSSFLLLRRVTPTTMMTSTITLSVIAMVPGNLIPTVITTSMSTDSFGVSASTVPTLTSSTTVVQNLGGY